MTTHTLQPESQHGPATAKKPMLAIALVAVLSSIAAFFIESQQELPLGDAPLLMLLCGCVLAFTLGLARLGHSIEFGVATMAGFFIRAGVDVVLNPGGHNLLPFEFAFYAIYACIGIAVVKVTSSLTTALIRCLTRG